MLHAIPPLSRLKRMEGHVRRRFGAGLLLVVPILITYVVFRFISNGVVGILERKGFVERRVAPADKRKRLVRSTEKGRAAFARASPAAEAARARLFERLSEGERGQLMRLLRKISRPTPQAGGRG